MWNIECPKKLKNGACRDKKCLYPDICPSLPLDHRAQIDLLRRISAVKGVKKVFVASGIRHDMVVFDTASGDEYVEEIVSKHVSGQLKIAPEHIDPLVLSLAGKPGPNVLLDFKDMFDSACEKHGLDQYLTYYFMAALPGCGQRAMEDLSVFCSRYLHTRPEQVQVFTPTPSTMSTAMYYSRVGPDGRTKVWSEHDPKLKRKQKDAVAARPRA